MSGASTVSNSRGEGKRQCFVCVCVNFGFRARADMSAYIVCLFMSYNLELFFYFGH